MPSVTRRGLAAAFAVAIVVCAFIAYGSPMGVDYLSAPCDGYLCDDAGPPIDALSSGDVGEFFSVQPPMGSFSLILRSPAAAAAKALGGHDLAVYRAGAFICLLGLGALAVWLMAAMARRRRPRAVALLVPAGLLVSPLTFAALEYGHPEELLGSALAVGGVVAAARGRWLLAGALLGCAIATKQWALLAVPIAMVASPRGSFRLPLAFFRLPVATAGFAGALTLPMLLADPSRFWLAQKSVGIATTFENTITASNVWFLLADGKTGRTITPTGVETTTQYSLSESIGHLTHPLVALLAVVAIVAFAVRRRGVAPDEALQLLALVFLVRCIFDPLTYSYHHAPFLIALIVYEGLRRRVPVFSAYAIAAILVMTHVVAPMGNAHLLNAFYLAWSLPLLAAMTVSVLAPERLEPLAERIRSRLPATASA